MRQIYEKEGKYLARRGDGTTSDEFWHADFLDHSGGEWKIIQRGDVRPEHCNVTEFTLPDEEVLPPAKSI